jgi:spermidine/putrescine transport system substrate-binding protein
MGMRGAIIGLLILLIGGAAGGYYWYEQRQEAAQLAQQQNKRELIILTWEDYIDEEIVKEFSEQTGIEVRFVHYEDDFDRDEKLEADGTRGFDLVLVSERALMIYRKKGWVATLTSREVPNLDNIEKKWFEIYRNARNFAVPYFWGTTGIVYRSDLVSVAPTRWIDLFDPGVELRGKIQMPSDPQELAGPALQALGYSMYSDRLGDYDQAKSLILKQLPYIHSFGTPDISEDALIVTGEVAAALTYSGDALALQEFNENIEYALPEEGSSLWMDFLVLMMSSENKAEALEFLNFINEPKIAARNAEYVYYATPNKAAKEHVSTEYLEDPVIFPDEEVLARCQSFEFLPGWVSRQIDKLFIDVLPAEEEGSEESTEG